MRVIENNQGMALACRESRRSLGLVPTMGALHAGHIALVRRARQDSATLAVSIFVNPAQFGPQEDLALYPRDLERDLALLEVEGVDLVFTPGPEEIYPPGFDTWIDPGKLAARLEGAVRPGHFRGVATVVTKLFNVVRPDRAYFGQKDGQQLAVIRQLVQDLNLSASIVVVPTVRDADGLALSSRNEYLTAEQRKAAPVIYQSLAWIEELWRSGLNDAKSLRRAARKLLEAEPLVDAVDYVSVANAETLEELDQIQVRAMASVAVRMGRIRLIDNIILEPPETAV